MDSPKDLPYRQIFFLRVPLSITTLSNLLRDQNPHYIGEMSERKTNQPLRVIEKQLNLIWLSAGVIRGASTSDTVLKVKTCLLFG